MKYEMPVLNEKQREKDIATAKEMKNHVEFFSHASGFDAEFLIRCASAYISSLNASGKLVPIHGEKLVLMYDAPPVPALKQIELPKRYDVASMMGVEEDGDGDLYLRDEVIEAIRAAGYEVKE